MIRLYLMPTVDDGLGHESPKYINTKFNKPSGDILRVKADMIRYGLTEPVFLVIADVTELQHQSLASHGDVIAFPENIDAPFQVTEERLKEIEGMNIPLDWIDNTVTFRDVARYMVGLFVTAKEHYRDHKEPLVPRGTTLDKILPSQAKGFPGGVGKTARAAINDLAKKNTWRSKATPLSLMDL